MAKSLKLSVADARDSLSVMEPSVLKGDNKAAGVVLHRLGINKEKVQMEALDIVDGKIPNVVGMGARDAVYQLERQGVKVKLHGIGRVTHQDIAAGTNVQTGMVCTLELK